MKISVVVPAYNEEKNLAEAAARIKENLPADADYELIFVDDGSRDRSLAVLQALHAADPRMRCRRHDRPHRRLSFKARCQ